jgi:transposase
MREQRRRRAAKLFQNGYSQAEVARWCGVSREAARKWYDTWKRIGLKGLRAKPIPGRPPKLTKAKQKKVVRALLRGPQAFGYRTDLWTLERIAAVIKRTTRVKYDYRHVWRVLLSLGWSYQKPETRARKRDENSIRNWVRYTWPRIQKRGLNSAHISVF